MATYYVRKTGSNGNIGTSGSPWLTISFGISQLSSGDTLIVGDGTYIESLGGIPNGTSTSSRTTVQSENMWGAIVRASDPGGNIVNINGNQYVKLARFSLDGVGNSSANGIGIEGVSRFNRFEDLEIKNIYGNQGILMQNNSPNNEFINLDVHHCGPTGYEHGGYLSSDNNLVQGGAWHDNVGQGIQFTNSASSDEPDNNTVIGVKFYNNGVYGVVIRGTTPKVYNSLFYDNGQGLFMAGSNGKCLNNTFYSNSGDAVSVGNSGNAASNIAVVNNIFWQNGNTISNSGSGTIQQNNLTVDPKFVGAPSNLQLLSTSPAIDAGVPRSEETTDFAGVSRPQGSAYDIGAYEFVGGGTPDTTPPSGSITAPSNGATVSGTITITCNATDNIGVANIQFYLDGSPLGGPVT